MLELWKWKIRVGKFCINEIKGGIKMLKELLDHLYFENQEELCREFNKDQEADSLEKEIINLINLDKFESESKVTSLETLAREKAYKKGLLDGIKLLSEMKKEPATKISS